MSAGATQRMVSTMFDQAFLKGETWDAPGAAVEHIETHAAHVFLCRDRAYKIKKPVKLPYLDFSTVEKRGAVLRDELAINRVFNPDLYVTVVEKRGEPVLVMNRFDAKDMLSWRVEHGRINDELARSLADMVAQSHAVVPRRSTPGADIMTGLGEQLSKAFTSSPDLFRPSETLEFHALFEEALQRLRQLLNLRGEQGLVRRCHGDMHCANIVVRDGKPALFDAIEFSEKIATIDVLYDLAFLLMDLQRRGSARAANVILNRYLNLRRNEEDLSGLAALPLFLSTRAGVRALVTADLVHELKIDQSLRQRGEALDYFRTSLSFLKPPKPLLVCIGGLSGTGKSTLSSRIAPVVGASPGALHVRSDVERKVMAGVDETERLPPSSYTRAASATVYRTVLARAEQALRAGHSVIIDAVFANENERHAAQVLATRCGAAFHGFWLDADPGILKSRVSQRRDDASDATPEVIDSQLDYDLGPMAWTRIDASGSLEDTEALIRRRLPYPPSARA